jgi:hypothetical protein
MFLVMSAIIGVRGFNRWNAATLRLRMWSGRRESNPRNQFGRLITRTTQNYSTLT